MMQLSRRQLLGLSGFGMGQVVIAHLLGRDRPMSAAPSIDSENTNLR